MGFYFSIVLANESHPSGTRHDNIIIVRPRKRRLGLYDHGGQLLYRTVFKAKGINDIIICVYTTGGYTPRYKL